MMNRKRLFQMMGLGALTAAGQNPSEAEAAPLVTYQAPPAVKRPPLVLPNVIHLAPNGTLQKMNNAQDYIIVLPNEAKIGGMRIVGGRNVSIIGGYLSTATGQTMPNIVIGDGAPGSIVLCEGLLIDGAHGGLSDAFHIQSPTRHVRLKMNRVDGLRGAFSKTHADVIQNLGCLSLRVEDLTGRSHYNSCYNRRENDPVGNPIGKSTWNRVNMGGYKTNPDAAGTDPKHTLRAWSFGTQPAPKAGDPTDPVNGLLTGSVWFKDCYADCDEAGQALGDYLWPHAGSRMVASCRAEVAADGKSVDWPNWRTTTYPPAGESTPSVLGKIGSGDAKVYGVIQLGPPPNGDFVGAGDVGLAYPRLA